MAIQASRPRVRIVSKGSALDTEVFLIGEDGTDRKSVV